MAYKRRLDDRGDLRRALGRAAPSRSACHCSPVATVVQRPLPAPDALVTINEFACKRTSKPGDALPERRTAHARARGNRPPVDRSSPLPDSGWAVLDIAHANLDASRGGRDPRVPAHFRVWFCRRRCALCSRPRCRCDRGHEGRHNAHRRRGCGRPSTAPASPRPSPHPRPLPFLCQSTGLQTRFSSRLNPEPRSRRVFQFHQPTTLAMWLVSSSIFVIR